MTDKTNDRITIKGTAPKFEEQTLKILQAARHNVYDQTDECTALVRGDIPILFLSNVIEYNAKGYTLSTKYPVSIGSGGYSCRMVKPEHVVHADLEALNAQVKQNYIADLEREREEFKQLLMQQLLETRALAEAKKIADKQAKALAEIEKEVNDAFGELVIPL